MDDLLLTNDKVKNYFATINPIASKIQNDIDIIKSKYSKNWNNLSFNEQIIIVNEAIFNSKISLKYFEYVPSLSTTSRSSTPIIASTLQHEQDVSTGSSGAPLHQVSSVKSIYNYENDLSMYCKMKTGRKFLHDDTFGGFRDEHSAPFSFKSKSQANLNIFPAHEICNPKISNVGENSFTNNDNDNIKICKHYNPSVISDQNEESNINLNKIHLAANFIKNNNAGMTNNNNASKEGDMIHSQMFSNFLLIGKKIDGVAGGINDDEEVLVNCERISSKSSVPSEEDNDERNIEVKSLLRKNEIRQDYDFLANW